MSSAVRRWIGPFIFAGMTFAMLVGAVLPFVKTSIRLSHWETNVAVNVLAACIAIFISICIVLCLRRSVSWIPVVAVGMGIRLAILTVFWNFQPTGDAAAYLSVARELVTNHVLRLIGPGLSVTYAVFPPGYSIALALPMSLGASDLVATLLVNFSADILSALALYGIGRELAFDQRRAALIASLYFALPVSLTGSFLSNKESMAVCLALLQTFAFLKARHEIGRPTIILLGFTVAALILTQPGWLGITAGLGILLLNQAGWKHTLNVAIRSLPVALIVMSPWWLRNYLLFHRFIPITNAAGLNLYFVITNSYDASSNLLQNGRNEVIANSLGWSLSATAIRYNPLDYLKNQTVTFIYAWIIKGWQGRVIAAGGFPYLGAMISRVVQFYSIGLMALSALAAARRNVSLLNYSILAAVLLGIVSTNFWFEFGERHLFVVMALFLLIAGGQRVAKGAAAGTGERVMAPPRSLAGAAAPVPGS